MSEDQKFCVVAEDRGTKKRIDITGPLTGKQAAEKLEACNASYHMKKYYKYFKIAKYPYYKEKK
jgi:hypothetical protein